MLCDKILDMLGDPHIRSIVDRGGERAINALADVTRRVRAAQRFVLSPHTLLTVNGLCDPAAVERAREHLFFPARLTWLEWAGEVPWRPEAAQVGCLFVARDEGIPRLGDLILFLPPGSASDTIRHVPVPGIIDLAGTGPLLRLRVGGTPTAQRTDVRLAGAWIGAALALINTPRIANIIHHDHQALNAARAKRGRPPVLSWHEVAIALDRGTLGLGHQITQTGERAYHHVRAFLRLRRGRVELVRPHWRGNPQVGVVRHRYTVSRAEDEGGEWKGGPLPPPAVIGALAEDDPS